VGELDPNAISQLRTEDEARNYVIEKIHNYEEQRNRLIDPAVSLIASDFVLWERRLMIKHGEAIGALCALQAFGIISPEVFMQLKNLIISNTLYTAARAQLGT
jgi:hypothetical protein